MTHGTESCTVAGAPQNATISPTSPTEATLSCMPGKNIIEIKLSADAKFTLNSIFKTRGGNTVISASSTVEDTASVAISSLHPGAEYDVTVAVVGFEGTASSLAVSMPSVVPTDTNNFANLSEVLHQPSDPAVAGPALRLLI